MDLMFPGQNNFQHALPKYQDSLKKISYGALPDELESCSLKYKPYEPNFYSTLIQDWGTFMWANEFGDRGLITLGRFRPTLPNSNMKQICVQTFNG